MRVSEKDLYLTDVFTTSALSSKINSFLKSPKQQTTSQKQIPPVVEATPDKEAYTKEKYFVEDEKEFNQFFEDLEVYYPSRARVYKKREELRPFLDSLKKMLSQKQQ